MTNITPSAVRIEDIKYYGWAVYEDQVVDLGDTLTLSEFRDDVNLSQVLLVNNASGAVITTSVLNNVVTVASAATDAECTLFAFGRRV